MKITFGIETITPQEAERILKESAKAFADASGGFKQRNIREATVNAYAEDIAAGRWKENGETIKFDTEGRLIDGQHRLSAVVKANVSCQFFVVRGLDNSVMDTIDYGMKRSIENALQFQCKSYESGAAAVVRHKVALDKHRNRTFWALTTDGVSHLNLVEEYIKNEAEYNESVHYGRSVSGASGNRLTATEVAAVYMHLTKTLGYSDVIVKTFFDNLCSVRINERSIYNNAITKLGNKLTCRGAARTIEIRKCWNGMVKGSKYYVRDNNDTWFINPTK